MVLAVTGKRLYKLLSSLAWTASSPARLFCSHLLFHLRTELLQPPNEVMYMITGGVVHSRWSCSRGWMKWSSERVRVVGSRALDPSDVNHQRGALEFLSRLDSKVTATIASTRNRSIWYPVPFVVTSSRGI